METTSYFRSTSKDISSMRLLHGWQYNNNPSKTTLDFFASRGKLSDGYSISTPHSHLNIFFCLKVRWTVNGKFLRAMYWPDSVFTPFLLALANVLLLTSHSLLKAGYQCLLGDNCPCIGKGCQNINIEDGYSFFKAIDTPRIRNIWYYLKSHQISRPIDHSI